MNLYNSTTNNDVYLLSFLFIKETEMIITNIFLLEKTFKKFM